MIVTCRDLAARLTELEEGVGSAVERASLRFHLSICARCRRYVAELDRLKDLLADLGREEEPVVPMSADAAPDPAVARALSTFRAWKTGESSPDDD